MSCDDRLLVEGCLSGRDGAFRDFVERFEALVFGVCLRILGDRHEAEDVAQEVFLRAHRSLRRWDPERPLKAWLMAIAVNRCRTQLGKRRRRPAASEVVDDMADPRPDERDGDELRGLIWGALDELRADYRQVFLLFHEQGLDYEAMSEATGRPIGTLKTWLHRARAELLSILRKKGWKVEEGHDPARA